MTFPRLALASSLVLAAAFAVAGCGSSGTPTSSAPYIDTAPPAVPAGLAVAFEASSGLDVLQWAASPDPDLARYQIFLYSPSPDRENSYALVDEVTGTSLRLPVVSAGTTLYYRVRAVDLTGNRSAMSAPFQARIAGRETPEDPAGDDPPPLLRR